MHTQGRNPQTGDSYKAPEMGGCLKYSGKQRKRAVWLGRVIMKQHWKVKRPEHWGSEESCNRAPDLSMSDSMTDILFRPRNPARREHRLPKMRTKT